MTSVTRLISWNQWRVEVTPQRVQTDCTGRNCSPQFSQNKCASQNRDSDRPKLATGRPPELLYFGTGLPNPLPCRGTANFTLRGSFGFKDGLDVIAVGELLNNTVIRRASIATNVSSKSTATPDIMARVFRRNNSCP